MLQSRDNLDRPGMCIRDFPPALLKTPFGSANFVSLETFFNTYLPRMPDFINLEGLSRKLRRQKSPAHRIIAKNGRLWGYSRKQPIDFEPSDAFKYLYACAESLVKVLPLCTPRNKLYHNNANAWYPSDRSEDSLPDAYLCRLEDDGLSPAWTTIALSGAYALDDSEEMAVSNMEKITHAMSNCMLQDPRRRYTFGYTIECSDMRLWYCDRANIIMSQSFDFTLECRTLLSFFLRVLFADEYDLGFDPTMTVYRTLDDGSNQYDIVVRLTDGTCQTYRTKRLLSDGAGTYLLGRGTRVWEAVRLENGVETDDLVALKDSWVDGYREREATLNSRIRSSAVSRDERNEIDEMVVNVSAYGDVYINGVPDQTRPAPAVDACGRRKASSTKELFTGPQIHSRIVYQDVGHPLRHVASMHSFFTYLAQVVEDLRVLHQHGWVHCDLSPGNVIIVDGRPKLNDFEYARHESNTQPHEMTGARDFRPAEVDLKGFWWMAGTAVNIPLPQFRYFPLHDLESLWWFAAHFIITRAVMRDRADAEDAPRSEEGKLDDVYYDEHQDLAIEMFGPESMRSDVMTVGLHFSTRLERLHPSVVDAGLILETSRKALVRAYVKAEVELRKMDFHCADGVHEMLRDCFIDIAEKYKDVDFHMEPVSYR